MEELSCSESITGEHGLSASKMGMGNESRGRTVGAELSKKGPRGELLHSLQLAYC